MKKTLLLIPLLALLGCTQNERARYYGGTQTIKLPAGQKLVVAAWKEGDLWYLMRSAKAGESAETLIFQESSSFGLLEGKVIFQETL